MSGSTQAAAGGEATLGQSGWPLLGAIVAATAGATLVAGLVALGAGGAVGAAVLGALCSGAVALLGGVILRAAGARPAIDWLTLWLAATVVRMLLTPVVAVLLYSALPLPPKAFFLAVAGSYLACLAAETVVLARSAGRALDAAAASRGANEAIEVAPSPPPSSGDRSPGGSSGDGGS
jgi:hypothetical protein